MNGGTVSAPARPSWPGLLAALCLAAACVLMRTFAQAPDFLWSLGAQLFLYNVVSLVATVLVAFSCCGLGQLLCRFRRPLGADALLIATVAGTAAFMFLGYAVGLAGLLKPWLCLSLLVAPLPFFPAESLCALLAGRAARLLAAALGVLFVYLFAVSGVLANFITNDFGHYLPMYDLALTRGDLLPNIFYNAYYAAKGDGLAFLFMAATSSHAIYSVCFLALCLILLMAGRYTALVSGSRILGALFIVILLATRIVRAEMYKAHIISSMFILAAPFMLSLLFIAHRQDRPAVFRACVATIAGMLVITPLDGAFLSLPLLAGFVLALLLRRGALLRRNVALIGVSLAVFFGMLGLNFALTGMPEIKPFTFFWPFMDLHKVDGWISVNTVVSLGSINHSTGFVFTPAGLLRTGLKLGGLVLALVGGAWLLRRVYPMRLRHYVVLLAPIAALHVVTIFFKTITHHLSFADHTTFESVLNRMFLCYAVLLLVALAARFLRNRTRLRPDAAKIAFALFAVLGVHAVVFNWLPPLRQQIGYARSFVGQTAPATLFGAWRDPAAEEVQRLLPPGERVFSLYFSPYAYTLPGQRFERPENSETMRFLPQLLDSDVDAAARIYKELGFRRFTVFVWDKPDEGTFLTFNVYQFYGPLFDAENVARRFRVRPLGGNKWLMTLDGGDQDGQVPDGAFLARYAAMRERDMAKVDNYSLEALRVMRGKLPELARIRNKALETGPNP